MKSKARKIRSFSERNSYEFPDENCPNLCTSFHDEVIENYLQNRPSDKVLQPLCSHQKYLPSNGTLGCSKHPESSSMLEHTISGACMNIDFTGTINRYPTSVDWKPKRWHEPNKLKPDFKCSSDLGHNPPGMTSTIFNNKQDLICTSDPVTNPDIIQPNTFECPKLDINCTPDLGTTPARMSTTLSKNPFTCTFPKTPKVRETKPEEDQSADQLVEERSAVMSLMAEVAGALTNEVINPSARKQSLFIRQRTCSSNGRYNEKKNVCTNDH